MNRWIPMVWQVALPAIQVLVLTVVQIAGFMLAANLAGLGKARAPMVSPTIVENERTETDKTESVAKTIATRSDRKTNSESVAQPLKAFGLLALACLLNAVALVFWVRQTSLAGIPLILTVFVCFFMCMTVMPQSDTFFFIRDSSRIIRSAATLGSVVSVLVAIASAPIFCRWRTAQPDHDQAPQTISNFVSRLIIAALIYIIIYVVFGYFIAWQSPELRNLYGGGDQLLGFWERIMTPPVPNRVIPFQVMRGIVWSLICLFMLRNCSGHRARVAIAISLFIAVVANSQLLLPNPIMSENVRLLHLLETATSNFLYGMICVWIWTH